MYGIFDKLNSITTPDEQAYNKHSVKRKQVLSNLKSTPRSNIEIRVDEILDKINQKGYDSLSKEEREILTRASKDNS